MERFKQLFFAVLIALASCVTINAHDFEAKNADGVTIYYKITSSKDLTCSVTYKGSDSYYAKSYSGSVTIPSSVEYNDKTYSVTSIGISAFDGCFGLTSVEIPNSVTSIDIQAFYGCSSLTSIEIPNSVTSIGESAFSGCSSLTSVEIPNSVTSIGDYAFSGCSSLPVENNLRYADTYLVGAVDKTQSSYSIKAGTKWIGGYAFSGCSRLTSIDIPNSVTSIGDAAFRGCSSLPVENNLRYADTYLVGAVDKTQSSYSIKAGTKWIGNNAFENYSSLTSVEIPNSVTSIGNYAFYNCSSLTSVEIPNSVTSIGYSAFYGCI